jgi:hypothetical protein
VTQLNDLNWYKAIMIFDENTPKISINPFNIQSLEAFNDLIIS